MRTVDGHFETQTAAGRGHMAGLLPVLGYLGFLALIAAMVAGRVGSVF